jgi:hypothetical protein
MYRLTSYSHKNKNLSLVNPKPANFKRNIRFLRKFTKTNSTSQDKTMRMRDSLPNEIALENDVLSLEDDGYELEEAVLAELAAAHVQLLHVLRSSVDGSQLPAALN